jgi:hypothetical protein
MPISILDTDGSLLANDGTNGISILGPDGALMPNNGSNGIVILDTDGAYQANDGTVDTYSILDTNGALAPYEEGNTYSILDIDGSLAAYDIQSLFLNGEQGVWYDPSDFSTLYQDAAGTTPVTAVGQPVGLMLDKSGNGNHASQSTDDARPILGQDDAGHYYLEFDGSNDRLVALFTIAQPIDRISGIEQLSWTLGDQIIGGAGVGAGLLFQSPETPAVRINSGPSGPSAVLALETPGVVTERHNGTNSRIAVNNGVYVTGNAGTVVPLGISVGGTFSGANAANVRFYGTVMRGGVTPLTDAKIAMVRRFIGSRCGVAL